MSDDIKKELESLSEDVSERTDSLLRDLIEEEEGREEGPPKEPPKDTGRWKTFLIIGGIFFLLLGIGLGLFFLWSLLKGPSPKEVSKVASETKRENRETPEGENRTEKESRELIIVEKEKITPSKGEENKKYNYNLKLANFLFPLDEKNFLKVDVHLFFDSYDRFKKAQEREFELRNFFYQEFRRAEINVWRREDKLREYEERLKNLLIKEKLEVFPERLELEGIILKT